MAWKCQRPAVSNKQVKSQGCKIGQKLTYILVGYLKYQSHNK